MSTENYISKMYKFLQDKKITEKEFIQLVRSFISNKFSMELALKGAKNGKNNNN